MKSELRDDIVGSLPADAPADVNSLTSIACETRGL